MSKQFNSKKETLSFINKIYGEKNDISTPESKLNLLEQKYETLAKRTKALEKVYQFHKGIIQNISSGLITIDMDKNITFINTAALKLLTYDYQELVGKPVQKIFADEQEAESILHELLTRKRMYESREINLISRQKKLIPIGFTTTPLNAADNSYNGIIFSFRDLTHLQYFRMQMERIDRLTTLGEVSAGIAHEIRNPLAGIKTSAQLLEESFSPADPRSQLVRRIVKEIDRSNTLLKKFFNFAKPGKPKQDFVSLESLVEGVNLLLSSKMQKKAIVFTKNCEADVPDIYVDENQMEQILINLFLNSIDALPSGGEILVNIRAVAGPSEHAAGGDSSGVEMEFIDSGHGIEKENLEKIFNPFFTTKSDGVGLGLSITSRLIQENGGTLVVDSEPGQGARFVIRLPAG
jgi:PAS domain S-box-containing protein